MILKLYYQNEIHRCSDPPTDVEGLRALIASTFRTELPQEFSLFYTIAGEVENVPISSQDDYLNLLSQGSSKTAKVLIREKDNGLKEQGKPSGSVPTDYDIISNSEKSKKADFNLEEERKNEIDEGIKDLGTLVEQMSESVVVPQVQQKYPYFSHSDTETHDQHIRKIVQETLKDQIPSIISQVKDAVLKELRSSQPNYQINNQVPKAQSNLDANNHDRNTRVVKLDQDQVEERKVQPEVIPSSLEWKKVDFYEAEDPFVERQLVVENVEKNDFVNKMKKFGNALKDQLVVLPEKAKNAFDDLSQKLEGDPYVVCEEGKFPKSVLDKVAFLKEVFPEEEKRDLIDFVRKYPRYVTLEQLANLFLAKDQLDEVVEPNLNQHQEANKEESGHKVLPESH